MTNMKKPARFAAIIACFLMACSVRAATSAKPTVGRVRKPQAHFRNAHPAYRTIRYARKTSHVSHPTHPSKAKRRRYVRHHYVRHRYVRRRRYYRHRIRLPRAPSPERITQIQTALARGGYYKGDPTGKWDADTVAAVQKFQSSNNIDATGKLDAPTLQKLGLGSDIAGVAAPRPVVPKISPGAPANAAPALPAKPAGTVSPAPSGDHAQAAGAAAATNSAPNSAASSASSSAGSGASSTAAIAPSADATDGAASDSTSASKPAANQH
jgi:hypothetical protein